MLKVEEFVAGSSDVVTERREGDSNFFGARTSAIQQACVDCVDSFHRLRSNARASHINHIYLGNRIFVRCGKEEVVLIS
jgi:hypothetical protein